MRTTLALTATALLVLAGCGGTDTTDGDAENGTSSDELMSQAQDIQTQLDSFFEGCEWEVSVDDGNRAETSCSEHEVGVIVGQRGQTVDRALDRINDELPIGGYVAEDNWAVWSTDEGNVNVAWDVLGASGERGQFTP